MAGAPAVLEEHRGTAARKAHRVRRRLARGRARPRRRSGPPRRSRTRSPGKRGPTTVRPRSSPCRSRGLRCRPRPGCSATSTSTTACWPRSKRRPPRDRPRHRHPDGLPSTSPAHPAGRGTTTARTTEARHPSPAPASPAPGSRRLGSGNAGAAPPSTAGQAPSLSERALLSGWGGTSRAPGGTRLHRAHDQERAPSSLGRRIRPLCRMAIRCRGGKPGSGSTGSCIARAMSRIASGAVAQGAGVAPEGGLSAAPPRRYRPGQSARTQPSASRLRFRMAKS